MAWRFGAWAWAVAVACCLLAPVARGAVVINEIMYNPASDDRDESYVELYNTSATPVDLQNWRFTRGITFTFPNVTLAGNDYLVVCRNQARVQAVFGTSKTVGNFTGNLAGGGEMLELVNSGGGIVDRVQYGDRTPWPIRADGNGAALGLINPALGNSIGDYWEAEATVNVGWRKIVAHGVFDINPATDIKFYLELDGAALIDDVELVRDSAPGVNLLSNGGFEAGAAGWTLAGNHAGSTVEAGDVHAGSQALHVRATGQGDFGGNHLRQSLSFATDSREPFTLSLWAKPLDDINAVTLGGNDGRHGTFHEAFALSLSEPIFSGGSPGAQNVVYLDLPQPLIRSHGRTPNVPLAGLPADVRVIVDSPARVASANLHYAIQSLPLGGDAPDPDSLTFTPVAMNGNATTYTVQIPGQVGGTLVRYYVEFVSDNGGVTLRRPRVNDVRQYYGYYVRTNAEPAHDVPVFYLQVGEREELLINELADDLGGGMFKGYNVNVRGDLTDLKSGEYFGDVRTRWRGGVGTRSRHNNIKVQFNDGHRWDGLRTVNLTPNNQGRAVTTLGIANALVHELERRLGVPSLDMAQWARVYYDGGDRGLLTMVEQPDAGFLERFGLSTDGQLFKSIGWRLAYPSIRGDEAPFYGAINDGQDGRRKLRDSTDNQYLLEEYASLAYDQELDSERGFTDLLSFIQSINDIPFNYAMPTANPDYVWLTDCVGSQQMTSVMGSYLDAACNVGLMQRKFALDAIGGDTDRVVHNHYWCMSDDGKWFLLSWDRDFWSNGYANGYALFMQCARWYKAGTAYPRTWRLPANIHTGSWPSLTVMMWPPEFRERYYRIMREAYEEIATPYAMRRYTDKQLAYVQPEHALAGSTPALNVGEFQTQQDWLNAQRVRVFQYMQTVFDMPYDVMRPLVCDVRHAPAVPAPAQWLEFQAHAVSSTGAGGDCGAVTLMLKGPGDAGFLAHAMTRVVAGTPDPNRTWRYTAAGLNAGEQYEYYVVANDTSTTGAARSGVMPHAGPAAPRIVMADDNPTSAAQGVVINEIMYNSDLPANEYVELYNWGARAVDLGGWSLIDSSTRRPFVFEADTILKPGQYLVVAGNGWSVRRHYGLGLDVAIGDFAFRLADEGDTVQLLDAGGAPVDVVAYSDDLPWPTTADGGGASLELIAPRLDNNDPASYETEFPAGHRGTPGAGNFYEPEVPETPPAVMRSNWWILY